MTIGQRIHRLLAICHAPGTTAVAMKYGPRTGLLWCRVLSMLYYGHRMQVNEDILKERLGLKPPYRPTWQDGDYAIKG